MSQSTRYIIPAVFAAFMGTAAPLIAQTTDDVFGRAEALVQSGQAQQAILLLKPIVDKGSQDPAVLHALAKAYIENAQPTEAEGALIRAQEFGMSADMLAMDFARAYLLQREYRKALGMIQSYIPADEHLVDVLVVKGDAQIGLKQVKQAEKTYKKAVETAPDDYRPYLGLARIALKVADLRSAHILASESLKRAPGETMVHYTLGLIKRIGGDSRGAQQHFDQAIELYSQNILARLERATLLIDQGLIQTAEKDLDVIFANSPNNMMAKYLSAAILAKSGKYSEANNLLRQADGLVERYIPAAYVKGLVSLQLGLNAQAERLLSKVLVAQPDREEIKQVLAVSQIRQNKFSAARKTLALFEQSGEALKDVEALSLLGAIYMGLGETEKATGFYERAVALGGADAPSLANIQGKLALARFAAGKEDEAVRAMAKNAENNSVRNLALLASMQLRKKDFEQAVKTADRIIANHPDRALGFNIKGTAQLQRGEYEAAIVSFDAALERNPNYRTARRNKGLAYLRSGNSKAAEDILAALSDADPSDVRSRALYGKLLLNKEAFADAVVHLRVAERELGGSVDLSLDLAEALLKAGKFKEALAVARKTAATYNENPTVLERAALVMLEAGDANRAASTLALLVAYRGNDPVAHFLHARALMEAGLYAGARNSLRFVSDLDGNIDLKKLGYYWYSAAIEFRADREDQMASLLTALDDADRPSEINAALKGNILSRLARHEEAVEYFRERLKSDAENQQLYAGLAEALIAQGNHDQAVDVMRSRLGKPSADRKSFEKIAEIYQRAGHLRAAKDAYMEIFDLGVRDPMVSAKLALLLVRLRDSDAVDHAAYAYRMLPNNPFILNMYGFVALEIEKDVDKAVTYLAKATKRAPGTAVYRYHLAKAYLLQGEQAKAIAELKESVRLNQQFDGLEDAKKRLKVFE